MKKIEENVIIKIAKHPFANTDNAKYFTERGECK